MLDSIVLEPLRMKSTNAFDPAFDPALLPQGYMLNRRAKSCQRRTTITHGRHSSAPAVLSRRPTT